MKITTNEIRFLISEEVKAILNEQYADKIVKMLFDGGGEFIEDAFMLMDSLKVPLLDLAKEFNKRMGEEHDIGYPEGGIPKDADEKAVDRVYAARKQPIYRKVRHLSALIMKSDKYSLDEKTQYLEELTWKHDDDLLCLIPEMEC